MLKNFTVILLAWLVLSACAPATTAPTPVVTPETVNLTATLPLPVEPTQTAEPTLEPIKLPVDRFSSLPNLAPLTAENIKNIEAVATFQEAQLIEVKVSPAQDRVAFAFNNGIQFFDLPGLTPKPFLSFNLRDAGGRRTFRLSPDARQLAMISKEQGNQVLIWNLETQKQTCALSFEGAISPGGSGPLKMEFFPETGLFLFNGRLDRGNNKFASEVRLVDLSNCQVVFKFQPRLWPILAVAPDGRFLAYVKETQQGYGSQAYLFNTRDKSEKMLGDEGKLRGVGFTSDSNAVIVANSYQTQLYNLGTGELLAKMEANLGKNSVTLYPLQDGHRILIAANETNRIWDYAEGTNFSPGNALIGPYRENFDDYNEVIVTIETAWNLNSKTAISLKKYPYGRWDSAISPDGRYMALESGYAPWQTDLIDLTTNQVLARLPGERGPVTAGEFFVTSGKGQSSIHRFATGEVVQNLPFQFMNGVSAGENQVLLWDAQGQLSLINAASGETLRQATLPVLPLAYYPAPDFYTTRHSFPAWEASLGYDPTSLLTGIGRDTALIAPDGTSAIQMAGEVVQIFRVENEIFHPTSENLLAAYPFKGVWFRFAYSPDSALVVGKTYAQLFVWDAKTGKQVRAFAGADYLKSQWFNLGFSPDGKLILVDSIQQKDRTLTVLETKTGKVLRTHSVANCLLDLPFVFTPDASGVFTVTSDCRIGLFSLADWQRQSLIGGPYSGAKLALALSPDGKFLAVGHKSALEIWNVDSGMILKRFKLQTGIDNFIGDFALEFSPDGKFLAARHGFGNSFFIDTTVTLFGVPTR